MRALELKIPPPAAALLIGLAMWAAAHLLPRIEVASQPRAIIAIACAGLGVIVAFSGFLAFRRAKTTVSPITPGAASSIVSAGVYSFTRNPMYVGLTAVLTGLAVWLSVPWLLLGPLALVLFLTRFQIIPEERALTSKFGRSYEEYRARVRRWL